MMKKINLTPFLFLATCLVFTACDLGSASGEDLLGNAETAVTSAGFDTNEIIPVNTETTPGSSPAPAPDSSNPPSTASGGSIPNGRGNGFLWKPQSESTGGLVILTPPTTRGRTQRVATISGSFGTESAPMRHEIHNGGRPHFYFSRPGREYGTNITVNVPLTDGSVYTVVVPDGSQRTE